MAHFKLIHDYDGTAGLPFFEQMLPEGCHAVAGYSGVSFTNTLRMLQYDLKNKHILKCPELSGVERIVALDSQGLPVGAAVSHFLPQFGSVLDYEQYLIVAAENADAFFQLLRKVRRDTPKYELITFRKQERSFLAQSNLLVGCEDIHYWQLYHIPPCDCLIPTEKVNCIPRLPKTSIPIEAMPQRYYAFANAGLPGYDVLVLPGTNGQPLAICSLLPYNGNQRELKLWYRNDAVNSGGLIASFLKKAIYKTVGLLGSAVWRVKDPTDTDMAIIREGQFACIGQEEHYHFNDNANKNTKRENF